MLLKAGQLIGAGAASVSLGSVGTGIGVVFSGLIIGTSRNPGLQKQLFQTAMLGFALTEAMALFAVMMAFLLLYGA
jgi:F-type H+-transporting ATPase subunit c